MLKNKKLFDLIAVVGIVLLFFPIFLKVWALNYNGNIAENFKYKLLDKFSATLSDIYKLHGIEFQSIWATLFMIVAVAAMFAGIVYLIFTIVEILKIKGLKSNSIKKFSSLALLVCFILSAVFGLVFISVNSEKYKILSIEYTLSMKAQIGFWLFIAGAFISGVFGALSSNIKPKKKTSKSKK